VKSNLYTLLPVDVYYSLYVNQNGPVVLPKWIEKTETTPTLGHNLLVFAAKVFYIIWWICCGCLMAQWFGGSVVHLPSIGVSFRGARRVAAVTS